jgi:membrane protein DedA with SNARE-associated domain
MADKYQTLPVMSVESLLITYGYPILFVGVLLEGETFLILAAYLAHRGYLNQTVIIIVGALATFLIVQALFHTGQRYGPKVLARRPRWQPRIDRVQRLLHRYGAWLIVGFRFLFGLRTIIPLTIGIVHYPALRFSLLNLVGALLWTSIIVVAGNGIARFVEVIVEDLRQHELLIVIVLAISGAAYGVYHLYKQPKLINEAGSVQE